MLARYHLRLQTRNRLTRNAGTVHAGRMEKSGWPATPTFEEFRAERFAEERRKLQSEMGVEELPPEATPILAALHASSEEIDLEFWALMTMLDEHARRAWAQSKP